MTRTRFVPTIIEQAVEILDRFGREARGVG
jgi:hypothetical protein